MQVPIIFVLFASSAYSALTVNRRAPARVAVTNNVLHLQAAPGASHLIPPSSKYLQQRRNDPHFGSSSKTRRQDEPIAEAQEDLITLSGRVYMTEVTLGGQDFTLVIDSGSSDTWVASSNFRCKDPDTMSTISRNYCGFHSFYDAKDSPTWSAIHRVGFGVNYTGGEFLEGELGTEELGIGGLSAGMEPRLVVNQTIGIVDEGFWLGDRVSSGLMGLAYPALVSGAQQLGYNSVMFTLTQDSSIPAIFSMALSRPTDKTPRGGGMLAIGGIPDIPHDGNFVTVSVQPLYSDIYAYYSIPIDGFAIIPPSPSPSSSSSTRASRRQLLVPNIDPATYPANMIVDSGSSLVYFPDGISDYIAALFDPPARYNSSTGLYMVQCNAAAPRVGVIIGGQSFYMSDDDLMNRLPKAAGGTGTGPTKGRCPLAIQRAGEGSYVLGDSWLKNVLVVFDLEGNEVRIAARENY